MIRPMCEQFVARAEQPFRLDALWPFAERLERYGIAGFGWGVTWLLPGGGLETYRATTAFRDDAATARLGSIETTSILVHLRRPSRLSTLQPPDSQPFDDPEGAVRLLAQRRPPRLPAGARAIPGAGPDLRPCRQRGR